MRLVMFPKGWEELRTQARSRREQQQPRGVALGWAGMDGESTVRSGGSLSSATERGQWAVRRLAGMAMCRVAREIN